MPAAAVDTLIRDVILQVLMLDENIREKIVFDRDTIDPSITAQKLRPDMMIMFLFILVFKGEEKGSEAQSEAAEQELVDKLQVVWPLSRYGKEVSSFQK